MEAGSSRRGRDLVSVRAQADRELAPYRSKMSAAQIDQLLKQYIHKRLLEKYGLPRLSLFCEERGWGKQDSVRGYPSRTVRA